MIVQCPRCLREYSLEESKIKPGGTKVRCRRCECTWTLTKDTIPKGKLYHQAIEIVKIIQKTTLKGDFAAQVHQLRQKIKDDQRPLNSTLRILLALQRDIQSINIELLKEYMKRRSLAVPNRVSLLILPKEDYQKQFPQISNADLDSAMMQIIDKKENQFVSVGVNKYKYTV